MATSAALAKQMYSGEGEGAEGDSRPDGKDQDEPRPATQRRGVVERAMADPGLLTSKETEEGLVRMLCAKVTRGLGVSKFTADFCHVSVMSKERGRAFADLLLTSIHQWFARRAELLPRRVPPAAEDHPQGKAGEEPRYEWAAFVDFLAELLAAMTGAGWSTPDHKSLWRVTNVAVLLCDCCDVMLRSPAFDVLDEVKCIQSSPVIAGEADDSAAAQHVKDPVVLLP